MADIDYDRLAAAIASANKRSSTPSAGAAPSTGSLPGPGLFKGLEDASKLAGNSLKGLIEGPANLQNALGGAGAALQNFGTIGRLSGDGLKYFGEYAQQSVDSMREFGKFGAAFSGDAFAMRQGIAQTQMSIQDYGRFLNKNKDLLSSMGGSVNQGAMAFNQFSKEFFDNNASQQLRELGLTTEEMNGTLAIEMANRRFVNLQDAEERKKAIDSAAAMATEMDKISKLTGKSREAQQEEMAALQRDGKYQAALRVAMMNGNKFAADGLNSAMVTMGKFGDPVKNLVKDFVAYGTASKEAAPIMASLGPAGHQLQQAIAMAKNAKTEEQKIAADAAVKEAERAVTQQLASKQFNENAALGIKGFQEVANATTNVTAGLDKVAAENGLDLNKAADRRKAQELLDKQVKDAQAGVRTDPKTGQKLDDSGRQATKAILGFEQAMGSATAVANNVLVKGLVEEVGPKLKNFADTTLNPQGEFGRKSLETKMSKGAANLGELLSQPDKAIENAQAGAAKDKAAGEAAIEAAEAKNKAAGKPPLTAEQRQQIGRAAEEQSGKNRAQEGAFGLGGLFTTTPGKVEVINLGGAGPAPVKRQTGSLGESGKLFENFGQGTPAILHGIESIMTPAQMQQLVTGAKGQGVKESIEKLGSGMKGMMPAVPNIDLSQLSSKITTSISSAVPSTPSIPAAGSSMVEGTVSSKVEEEAALASKKKLAALNLENAQYQKESAEKFVKLIEEDIAAKEVELAGTDSDRVKKRLERELAEQRTKLGEAKESVIRENGYVLEAEKSLNDIQQANISAENELTSEAIAQSKTIAEQTQPLLAAKAQLGEDEMKQSMEELSYLSTEKSMLSDKEAGITNNIEKLQKKQEIARNNHRIDAKDLAESQQALALNKEKLANAQTQEEALALQKEISEEEQTIAFLTEEMAKREKRMLDNDASIAEQQLALQDVREQTAEVDSEIAEKKQEILDSALSQAEIEKQKALEEAVVPERLSDQAGERDFDTVEPEMPVVERDFDTVEETTPTTPTNKNSASSLYDQLLTRSVGVMSSPKKTLSPAEAAKSNAVKEQDEKAKKTTETTQTGTAKSETSKPETKSTTVASTGGKEATLSDLASLLGTLNKQVGQMNSEIAKLPNLLEKTVSATKSLNGNITQRML